MGLRADVKAWYDYYFPWLPSTRRTSKDVNDLGTNINNAYCDKFDALDAAIAGLGAPSWASVTGKPSFATIATSGLWSDISGKPSFATVATSGAYSDLTGKPTIPTRSSLGFAAAATAITNSATNAPVDCPTNAPTDARTDYGVLAAILGADANSTNAKQNATAANVNSIGAKVNAGFGILNILAGKFNLSLDIYRNNGMLTP